MCPQKFMCTHSFHWYTTRESKFIEQIVTELFKLLNTNKKGFVQISTTKFQNK